MLVLLSGILLAGSGFPIDGKAAVGGLTAEPSKTPAATAFLLMCGSEIRLMTAEHSLRSGPSRPTHWGKTSLRRKDAILIPANDFAAVEAMSGPVALQLSLAKVQKTDLEGAALWGFGPQTGAREVLVGPLLPNACNGKPVIKDTEVACYDIGAQKIESGDSGAPVVKEGRVVGMVLSGDQGWVAARLLFSSISLGSPSRAATVADVFDNCPGKECPWKSSAVVPDLGGRVILGPVGRWARIKRLFSR
jgi:hypothetical protein